MVLRTNCNCCNKEITTKNAKHIGRNETGLWLNCQCGTTILMTKLPSSFKLMLELKAALPSFEAFRKQRKAG